MPSSGALALFGLLAIASASAAQTVSGLDARTSETPFRVRGQDVFAIDVLSSAIQLSATVARLVEALERSDVIVLVETGWLPANLTGQVRVLCARGSTRYLRVTLRIPGPKTDLMCTLGHELRHAVEIAAMPQVTDGDALAAAYERVGVRSERGGYYETSAAIEAGAQVARELAARRSRHR
jgi:hypothetical protein